MACCPLGFQYAEEYMREQSRSRAPIPIVCPFCESDIATQNMGWEETHEGYHKWDFVAKCETCGIDLTLAVEYHEQIIQPIGGKPKRIYPK